MGCWLSYQSDFKRWALCIQRRLANTRYTDRFFRIWQKQEHYMEGRSCNNYPTEGSGRGFIIYGDKGTLINNGNDDYKIIDNDKKVIKEVKSVGGGNGSNTISATGNLDSLHFNTFIAAVRGERKVICNIEEGHKSVLLCHAGKYCTAYWSYFALRSCKWTYTEWSWCHEAVGNASTRKVGSRRCEDAASTKFANLGQVHPIRYE